MTSLDPRDAEMDREDSLSERYAFSLGEDMGIVRFKIDQETLDDEMLRGYRRGLSLPARVSDIYLRKLLTLRRNAYSRQIPVSSALTKEYLKNITVTVCPVSGVDLTQGALTDTDWSIDRLDNTLGYVPGNLCVMAVRVNKIKDNLEHWNLADRAFAQILQHGPEALTKEIDDGIRVVECLRLASLSAAPYGIARGQLARYLPLAQAPSAWATIDTVFAAIHVECARSLVEGRAYGKRVQLFKRLGADYWRMSNRLVSRLRSDLSKGIHPTDVWFDGDTATLLRELTDKCLVMPMTLPGVTPDEALSLLNANTKSVGQFFK